MWVMLNSHLADVGHGKHPIIAVLTGGAIQALAHTFRFVSLQLVSVARALHIRADRTSIP